MVTRKEDTARLGCGESGMSCGAEVHHGTIEGIGVEAGKTREELIKLKRTMQLRECDVERCEIGA